MQELDNEAGNPPRIVIESLKPQFGEGLYPVKRVLGGSVQIEAVIICDGGDVLSAKLLYRHEDEQEWKVFKLTGDGNDIWRSQFQVDRLGHYFFTVEAHVDRVKTWAVSFKQKILAQQDVSNEISMGCLLLKDLHSEYFKVLESFKRNPAPSERLLEFVDRLLQNTQTVFNHPSSLVRYGKELKIKVDPQLAQFSSWYSFFPRSTTTKEGGHSSFKNSQKMLEYVSDLGFDIVYLPPIHPIGHSFRKGKNNSTKASSSDVGSPWAIGNHEGGHKTLHEDLGNFGDFKAFVEKAENQGLKVALDLAFQCSPDHPYVTEHSDWFKKKPDGSIQYAENPPKKYQDIYPLDFEGEDWRSLWMELKSIVQFWIDHGISIFRVDNPHTKPFPFWKWLLNHFAKSNPDVIFLAEAFTRPHVMYHLAKIGFHQSYTYFTWRNNKYELTEYMKELIKTPVSDYFRPCFWPNTPDILHKTLQDGGRPSFLQRLILASTLSSNYGIYGPAFELCENRPQGPGSEEYLDSEKYQLKQWDLDSPLTLAPFLKKINHIRKQNPALQSNESLSFHNINNTELIAYSKISIKNQNIVLIILSLSQKKQQGLVNFSLHEVLGDSIQMIENPNQFKVRDLLTDNVFQWSGDQHYVELSPDSPAHILVVETRNSIQ